MVRIEPWGAGDRELLAQCVGDPAMMEHLGGAESPSKVDERQARYEVPDSHQFKIVLSDEGAGWVGYWERDDEAYEIGWAVIPAFQGRGVASVATRLALDDAAAVGGRRYVLAYPSVDNGPSNGLCRKLGFELVGTTDYEYPPGNPLRCNDWRFDLTKLAVADPDG